MKLRFLLRLFNAYIVRFKVIILAGILIGIVFFFVSTLILPRIIVQTERIGITGRYHTDNLPPYVLNHIGQGLTKVDASGVAGPSLASSWETPDKGKTWVFHLKDDMYWQDETLVTSDTLVYEFSDVTINTPDEKTIAFNLQDPYSPFPTVVSKPTFRKGLMGTGEWQVKKVILAGSYIKEITIKKGRNEKKIFKFYPTDERTRLAYKLGHVDKIISILDPADLNEWPVAEVKAQVNEDRVITLFFNTKNDFLSDKSVRQALTYAIDKSTFPNRAISPISPNSWAYNPQVKKYSYDSQRAKDLLEDIPNEIVENTNLKLVTSPVLLSLAEQISENWKQVGVDSTVLVTSIIPEDFHVYLTIFDIPNDPDQYPVWHSTQLSTNISKYEDPRIDKLLEDGRLALEITERRKIYLDFQRFLLEDVPAAFLYHPAYYEISRK